MAYICAAVNPKNTPSSRFIHTVVLLNLCVHLVTLTSSCVSDVVKDARHSRVDSLNLLSYQQRYRNIEQSLFYAREAELLATNYADGMAEALNHEAYVCYQQMDFDGAISLCQKVYQTTNNQLELLVADVMMMKVCQRTSDDTHFFLYRNQAEKRLKRIGEAEHMLSGHNHDRLVFARSEFRIVSSTYFYYLQQYDRALNEINLVRNECPDITSRDTAQWLYYTYMKGSGGLCEGDTSLEIRLREFDFLFRCYTQSRSSAFLYFEANSLQALASLLKDDAVRDLIKQERRGAYEYLSSLYGNVESDSLSQEEELPFALARRALECFEHYDDLFQTACAYRTLGELEFHRHNYDAALVFYQNALSFVNQHHAIYYPQDSTRFLKAYAVDDTQSVEVQWLQTPNVKTVPEWIAGIRQQMSMAYSALDERQASDYNRNVYLDLLEHTRQDNEQESRYQELSEDTRILTWWLVAVLALIFLFLVLWMIWLVRWRHQNAAYTAQLQQALEEGWRILFSQNEKEQESAFHAMEQQELLRPYLDFAQHNRKLLSDLDDERQMLLEEKQVAELRITENKRKNVENRAKMMLVYGVLPFLDRIRNEVRRLGQSSERSIERLQYIDELVDKINEYNDLITQWIQLRQGELNLHIESFAVQELFEVIARGSMKFQQKGISLQVNPSDAWIKADKALTLFMLNTLADNAGKFTSHGGQITIGATETEYYVELYVSDTGCGLSAEDIDTICNSKVYNASEIGQANEEVKSHKGTGFGLLNCKGIIEKYRKTNNLFNVCLFGIESILGQGSRFYFRLPRIMRKALHLLVLMFTMSLTSCDMIPQRMRTSYLDVVVPDSVLMHPHIKGAVRCVDSLYEANIHAQYYKALTYADSACCYLNFYVQGSGVNALPFIDLRKDESVAEFPESSWLNAGIILDYKLLLTLRNETAVAALALHDWVLYAHNNEAYTRLYKALSEDTSLDAYCTLMERTRTNRNISLALVLIFIPVALWGFYFVVFCRRMQLRRNMMQVLHINKSLLAEVMSRPMRIHDVNSLQPLLQKIAEGLDEIHPTMGVSLLLHDDEDAEFITVSYGILGISESMAADLMKQCLQAEQRMDWNELQLRAYPLIFEQPDHTPYGFGVLLIHSESGVLFEAQQMTEEWVLRYVSLLIYQTVMRQKWGTETLETAEEERARAVYEMEKLHVQNQVLDNCLSTITHETMYYPGRIRKMVKVLKQANVDEAIFLQTVHELSELTTYYKEVYSLLCAQADRQLTEVSFRRSQVSVDEMLNRIEHLFKSKQARLQNSCALSVRATTSNLYVRADYHLLNYLMELLMVESIERSKCLTECCLQLTAEPDNGFVRFTWCETLTALSTKQVEQLFMPESGLFSYLICKQIIREHDMYTNHCGCRMTTMMNEEENSCTIMFTLPIVK